MHSVKYVLCDTRDKEGYIQGRFMVLIQRDMQTLIRRRGNMKLVLRKPGQLKMMLNAAGLYAKMACFQRTSAGRVNARLQMDCCWGPDAKCAVAVRSFTRASLLLHPPHGESSERRPGLPTSSHYETANHYGSPLCPRGSSEPLADHDWAQSLADDKPHYAHPCAELEWIWQVLFWIKGSIKHTLIG